MDDEKNNTPKTVEPEPYGKGVKVKVVDLASDHNPKPPRRPYSPPSTYLPSIRSPRTLDLNFLKISEVILRVGAGMLSLMALSVMVAATETRNKVGNAVLITIKFSDFQAYNYLVIINVLAFMYSMVQLIIFGFAETKSHFYSATFTGILATFICDQLMGYLLLSASSSGATASELSRSGVGDLWASICSDWELNSFCVKPEGAIGLSFLASFCVVPSSLISVYHLANHLRDKI